MALHGQISQFLSERDDNAKLLVDLFTEVGRQYESEGLAKFEINRDNDIHAFYHLTKDETKVIHVQGYPGFSSEHTAWVWARMMNYDKMMEIRSRGGISVGNEHESVIQNFPNFETGIQIPYDPAELRRKLEENCAELR